MATLRGLGEDRLVADLLRRVNGAGVIPAAGEVLLAGGDDAALLAVPAGEALTATCDALIEGTHFRRDWARAADVGWKALAVNLSDLAAMGARPIAALIAVGLPAETEPRWVRGLYAGINEAARRFNCPVVGGDTVRADAGVIVAITALGSVDPARALHRSGARAGDLVCVTGVLGDSGAGLALLQAGATPDAAGRRAIRKHLRPEPRLAAGRMLAESGLVTAMMDLSDGIAADLPRLARASGAGAHLEAERLPISFDARLTAAAMQGDAVDLALYGGEDYELLFTLPAGRFAEVPPLLATVGVTATVVGRITPRGLRLVRAGRTTVLAPRGFEHFPPARG